MKILAVTLAVATVASARAAEDWPRDKGVRTVEPVSAASASKLDQTQNEKTAVIFRIFQATDTEKRMTADVGNPVEEQRGINPRPFFAPKR